MKKYIDDAVEAGLYSKITYKKINEIGEELKERVNSRETNDIEKE